MPKFEILMACLEVRIVWCAECTLLSSVWLLSQNVVCMPRSIVKLKGSNRTRSLSDMTNLQYLWLHRNMNFWYPGLNACPCNYAMTILSLLCVRGIQILYKYVMIFLQTLWTELLLHTNYYHVFSVCYYHSCFIWGDSSQDKKKANINPWKNRSSFYWSVLVYTSTVKLLTCQKWELFTIHSLFRLWQ